MQLRKWRICPKICLGFGESDVMSRGAPCKVTLFEENGEFGENLSPVWQKFKWVIKRRLWMNLPEIRRFYCCVYFWTIFFASDIKSKSSTESKTEDNNDNNIYWHYFVQRYGWHGFDALLQKSFDVAAMKYSWLNDYREKAVTELEFLHGHLRHPGKRAACFFFRDKVIDSIFNLLSTSLYNISQRLFTRSERKNSDFMITEPARLARIPVLWWWDPD